MRSHRAVVLAVTPEAPAFQTNRTSAKLPFRPPRAIIVCFDPTERLFGDPALIP